MPFYSLTELNFHIRQTLEDNYPEALWITAEISSMSVNSYSGHCYLELSDGESQTARAKAMIWKKTFEIIQRKFQILTGNQLQKGIKIKVLAKVEFNPQYGLSLIVWDLDSEFSLGEIARNRIEVLQKLEAQGLTGKNKDFQIENFIRKFALISSSTAAGYQDFITHLNENQFGYKFDIDFFPSQMQGKEALSSIPNAINEIVNSGKKFEVVIIIRGGGSSSDLQVFDSYEIAKAIANCPFPVFTGIGHERDDSVSDQVANQRFKTPTAVADYLIEKMMFAENEVFLLEQKLAQAMQNQIQGIIYLFQNLNQAITNSFLNKTQLETRKLKNLEIGLGQLIQKKIFDQKEEFIELETRLKQSNPKAILQKGYARLSQSRKVKRSVLEIEESETLYVQLFDGELKTKIETINKK